MQDGGIQANNKRNTDQRGSLLQAFSSTSYRQKVFNVISELGKKKKSAKLREKAETLRCSEMDGIISRVMWKSWD